jgi:ribosomal protein L37E
MRKPEKCPQDVWENASHDERRCFVEGHNWYYDTCERCGFQTATQRKHEREREYERQVANLAGGR